MSRIAERLASRRLRVVGMIGLVVVLLVAAIEFYVFVRPPHDEAAPSDVVVVLGGGSFTPRLRSAIAVAQLKPGSLLLLSLQNPDVCPWQKYLTQLEVICFHANPATTQGEARRAAQLAYQHGARSITVVTSADQLQRARLRFSRCWSGELRMVEASASVLSVTAQVPYQTSAMLKALLLQRSC